MICVKHHVPCFTLIARYIHDLKGLIKLPSFCVTGMEHMIQWFQSYLSGRSQSGSFDGHLSDPLSVCISVAQGYILGPLLFLLFLHDLPTVTEFSKQIYMHMILKQTLYLNLTVRKSLKLNSTVISVKSRNTLISTGLT